MTVSTANRGPKQMSLTCIRVYWQIMCDGELHEYDEGIDLRRAETASWC